VKGLTAERENWSCDKCRTEKVRVLQEELQKAIREIEELKARNRELGAKLQMAGSGDRHNSYKAKVGKVCGDRGFNSA
jgi:hypothetical protein